MDPLDHAMLIHDTCCRGNRKDKSDADTFHLSYSELYNLIRTIESSSKLTGITFFGAANAISDFPSSTNTKLIVELLSGWVGDSDYIAADDLPDCDFRGELLLRSLLYYSPRCYVSEAPAIKIASTIPDWIQYPGEECLLKILLDHLDPEVELTGKFMARILIGDGQPDKSRSVRLLRCNQDALEGRAYTPAGLELVNEYEWDPISATPHRSAPPMPRTSALLMPRTPAPPPRKIAAQSPHEAAAPSPSPREIAAPTPQLRHPERLDAAVDAFLRERGINSHSERNDYLYASAVFFAEDEYRHRLAGHTVPDEVYQIEQDRLATYDDAEMPARTRAILRVFMEAWHNDED
jgi:hypothetical protein